VKRWCAQLLAAIALVCLTVPGCGSADRPSKPDATAQEDPRTAALPPLPDLESMASSVREQLIAQRSVLESMLKNTTAPAGDLARELGLMGQLLMASESVTAAGPYLRRAEQLEPMEPRWPYFLGHLHRMLGDSEGAARYFERTVMLRPDDVAALVWLANVSLAQGNHSAASTYYERAIARQPRAFAALFGLGRAAAMRGDFVKAVEQFETALRVQPNASAVHYPLALAYRELGRTADAEVHLRARGEYEPGPPDPLMEELAGLLRSPVVFERQGDRALARGDVAAAVAAFRRGLALAADHVPLKQKLATALAVSGDIPAALTLYQELLAQNPKFAEAHYSIGALHLGSGRPDLALPRFAAAVKAEPSYLHARLQLAHTLRRLGRLEAALVEYQGALAVDPRFADARFGYAISLAGLRRWGTARAWLIEGRRSHPERADFTEALARVLAAAPDENVRDEPAALVLARGLAGQPRSWNTLETLAMALAANGQTMEAASRQREAIDAYRTLAGKPSPGMTENLTRYERGERAAGPWTVDPIQ
jgi:tetratricopeptide (TPR) repeat protein